MRDNSGDGVSREDLERYRTSYRDEIDSAALYRALAEAEKQPELAKVYAHLAATEEEHARFWARKLEAAGESPPEGRPGWRPRLLGRLARTFGPQVVLPAISGLERQDSHSYASQPGISSMASQERSHARLLREISGGGGVEGPILARLEGRHRASGGNALRAAVLGANDGLLSNFSLVMGVAGASLSPHGILITGLAGLLAGAGSMAMGEWISVQSSRELYGRQIQIEAAEVREIPDEEAEELALIYQAKGVPEEQARQMATRIISDEKTATDTLSREELGIDPEELGGSAWQAAATSFALFALGAVVPILPFTFLTGMVAVVTSVVLSALGLFAIGALITVLTGRSALFSGTRQVAVGLAAAALTYALGLLIGTAIGG
ncbi:MAG: VIT1/CCC1 transporter family protein [Rubrobacteraceae bacterium]|nr:VIT1/CCC1 transporter family protein [Rubrobacteraceae bacterium]